MAGSDDQLSAGSENRQDQLTVELSFITVRTKLRRLCFYTCPSVHRVGCLVPGSAWSGGLLSGRSAPRGCLVTGRGSAPRRGAWSGGYLVPRGVWSGGCLVLGGTWCRRAVWSREGVCSRGVVSQHALRQTPIQQTATVADGTHPTEMHSC